MQDYVKCFGRGEQDNGDYVAAVLVLSPILANVLAKRISQTLTTLAHDIRDYEPPSPPHQIQRANGRPH